MPPSGPARSRTGRARRGGDEGQGIQPRYRRAFGCVTWLYMGILAFLAGNFLISLPFRYMGEGAVYVQAQARLAFLGLVLILPGMAMAAYLGARTYRAGRRMALRSGAAVGALIGWTGFFALAWLSEALGLDRRDQVFREPVFAEMGDSPAFFVFPFLALLAAGMTLYALYARAALSGRRAALLGALVLAGAGGLGLTVADPDPVGIAGAVIALVSGAFGGWVGGFGYARAGGEEMLPPGAVSRQGSGPQVR